MRISNQEFYNAIVAILIFMGMLYSLMISFQLYEVERKINALEQKIEILK